MIPGWDEGIVGMCIDEKRTLTIPPELAYGWQGVRNVIPGGATLVFGIELLKIEEGTINPATSNIGSNSGSSYNSGGYGSGGYGSHPGAAGGSYNQGFYPYNTFNEGAGLNNIKPFGDLGQNIKDLIPGLGIGTTLTNGINNIGTATGQYLNQLGNNFNNHIPHNQNQNQNQITNQKPTGLGNKNPLNCYNNNFHVDPWLCPDYIPESTHQTNNFDPLNDCRFNPAVPCPGATPIAGPTQGIEPTFRLPTGQGWHPNEPTRIVCKFKEILCRGSCICDVSDV